MNIQIWSDFSCPFCYIGKHNLEKAIKQLSPEQQAGISLHYRSFELNPDAPNYTEISAEESIAEKYNSTLARAKEMSEQATQIAATYGLPLNYKKVIPTSTLKAHQLQYFTAKHSPENIALMANRLFSAYFNDGLNLATSEVLFTIAQEFHLDIDKFKQSLENEEFVNYIRDDEALAHRMNISSVPFYVVNNELAIAGSQSPEDFLQFLLEHLP